MFLPYLYGVDILFWGALYGAWELLQKNSITTGDMLKCKSDAKVVGNA